MTRCIEDDGDEGEETGRGALAVSCSMADQHLSSGEDGKKLKSRYVQIRKADQCVFQK